MTNHILLEKIKKLVHEERRISVDVLECLWEIEKRKAYSELGGQSLFVYCVKELRYSEAQAYRRIQAMRAMKELPELKEKIKTGELTVSTVSQVQIYLKEERKRGISRSLDEKWDLFSSFQNQSSRAVQQELAAISGLEISMRLAFDLELNQEKQWRRIKDLSAHSTGAQDKAVLIMLMNDWLQRNDPLVKIMKTQDLRRADSPTEAVWKVPSMRELGECV